MRQFFSSTYWNQSDNGPFNCFFIEILGRSLVVFQGFCPNNGQHLKGFLVGHNQKEKSNIGCIIKKHAKGG
jgi:hypothetical protein